MTPPVINTSLHATIMAQDGIHGEQNKEIPKETLSF
jgi:hypothetical protein